VDARAVDEASTWCCRPARHAAIFRIIIPLRQGQIVGNAGGKTNYTERLWHLHGGALTALAMSSEVWGPVSYSRGTGRRRSNPRTNFFRSDSKAGDRRSRCHACRRRMLFADTLSMVDARGRPRTRPRSYAGGAGHANRVRRLWSYRSARRFAGPYYQFGRSV